jgi:hypothetical protein
MPKHDRLSVPLPLAGLAWIPAGGFSFGGAELGTFALQGDQEGAPAVWAVLAAGLILVATYLVIIAIASLPQSAESPDPRARIIAAGVATVDLIAAVFVHFAAAPGGLAYDESWAWLIAAGLGIWLAITALAWLGARLCWRVIGRACVALLLASVAVTIWHWG